MLVDLYINNLENIIVLIESETPLVQIYWVASRDLGGTYYSINFPDTVFKKMPPSDLPLYLSWEKSKIFEKMIKGEEITRDDLTVPYLGMFGHGKK